MSNKAEGKTTYNALTMVSEEVQLTSEKQAAWTVTMDKTSVSALLATSLVLTIPTLILKSTAPWLLSIRPVGCLESLVMITHCFPRFQRRKLIFRRPRI